jgi:lipopolysaccharide/colanic/teichoic acid biosynthesis glycosyltransferase
VKRSFERLIVIVAAIVLFPLLAMAGIAIKLGLRGLVIPSSRRVGLEARRPLN